MPLMQVAVPYSADLQTSPKVLNCWWENITHRCSAIYTLNNRSTNPFTKHLEAKRKSKDVAVCSLALLFNSRFLLLSVCWEYILLYINMLSAMFDNSTKYGVKIGGYNPNTRIFDRHPMRPIGLVFLFANTTFPTEHRAHLRHLRYWCGKRVPQP